MAGGRPKRITEKGTAVNGCGQHVYIGCAHIYVGAHIYMRRGRDRPVIAPPERAMTLSKSHGHIEEKTGLEGLDPYQDAEVLSPQLEVVVA